MSPRYFFALALTLVATPALACTGQSVYLEGNLKTGDQGWGPEDTRFKVDADAAVFTAEPGTQTARWDVATKAANLEACVTLTMPAETKDASRTYAGLVFWVTDKNNFHQVVLAPNGHFTIARKVDGQILSAAPLPWSKNDAIKTGAGATNAVQLSIEGEAIAVKVNDVEVARLRSQAPAAPSHIGLVAASAPDTTDTWRLSALKVTSGKTPETAPSASVSPAATKNISTGAVPTVASNDQCAGGKVLFADNFTKHDPVWGPKDERLSIDKGAAEFTPVPGTRTFRWNRSFVFGNLDACATIQLTNRTADSTSSYAGLMFWVEDQRNFYQAVLAPNGYFTVARVKDGKVQEKRPVDWTQLEVAKKGDKENNTLRVAAKGDEVKLYVNGKEVATFKGEPPKQPSHIGLLAASAAGKKGDTWAITNLKVSEPN